MTGHTPWWKVRARPVVEEVIWERFRHEPAYEGTEAEEATRKFADEILDALEEADLRITRALPNIPMTPDDLKTWLAPETVGPVEPRWCRCEQPWPAFEGVCSNCGFAIQEHAPQEGS